MNPRKAIITGSIKYLQAPLQYPQKDVELIAKALEKRCRFGKDDIEKILHTEKKDDLSYLEELEQICIKLNANRTNSYDLVVFYYSGHGVYKPGEQMSYLQISDDSSVAIDEVIKTISKVKAKNKYFIIDACQSGGFTLMKPKGKIQRQYTFNSNGIYCMFGTTKHQLAFEPTIADVIKKKVSNSFYTHFIVEALNKKANYNEDTISIRAIDDYASKKTPTYTNFEQIPFSTTEIAGYFPFGFWDETNELTDISNWENKTDLSQQYSSNQEIDIVNYLVAKIKRLFTEDKFFLLIPDKEMLANLSQPARDILNEKLDLANKQFEDKPLINGLIAGERLEKYHFAIFILEHPEINVDLTLKDRIGNSVLFEAIHNEKYNAGYIIELLFIRGYKVSSEEEQFLINEFESKAVHPDVLENIAIAIICLKLNDKDLIYKLRKIEKIVLTIISFKINRVIGYKLNQTALANNFLQHHKDFATIFIKALKEYGQYDGLKTKISFVKKEKTIMEEMPYQESDFDDLLMALFPELFVE